MRLLLLLLLVLAHALIAVQGLTAATRAPPPQTGPLLKDDAVTTEAAWSQIKVWRFEDTTPMDWLPPEEGFLEMPKPKKPPPKTPPPKKAAAKPVGPLQKATTRKPPTKTPAGSSTPRRPPTKPPAGSSTPRRPPTTSRPVRKARSVQEFKQPAARVGRRLMALPDVLQAKAVDRRKADVFSASLSCMEGVFLGRQDAAVKTVMLLRRPRSVAGRPDQRHDHDQHNNHQDNHNNDHDNNKNNHNDHRSRHTGDYSDIIGDLHDGGGSGDGSGGGEPEEEKTAAPPPQDPGGRAQLPLWPDEPGGRDRPQDGDRLPDVGPGWAPGERGQGPAGPPNSFLGDRDSFFGGQGDFMGDNNAFHGGVGGNPTGRGSYLGGRDSPPGGGDSNLGGGGW